MSLLDKIKEKQAQASAQSAPEAAAAVTADKPVTTGQATAVMQRMQDDMRDAAAVILLVSQIEVKVQARKTFRNLDRLAASIKKNGQLQPVGVVQVGTYRYELIFGERRYRAIKDELGNETILARIFPSRESANELRLLQLSENIHRDEYEPMELAEEFDYLLNENGWTHEQLAEHLHIARSWVTKKLSLLKAPEEVQDLIRQGKLAETEYFNNKDAVLAEVKNALEQGEGGGEEGKGKKKTTVATPRTKPEGSEQAEKPKTIAIPFTDAVRIAKLLQRLAEKHGLNPIEIADEPSKKELLAVLGRISDIKEVE